MYIFNLDLCSCFNDEVFISQGCQRQMALGPEKFLTAKIMHVKPLSGARDQRKSHITSHSPTSQDPRLKFNTSLFVCLFVFCILCCFIVFLLNLSQKKKSSGK